MYMLNIWQTMQMLQRVDNANVIGDLQAIEGVNIMEADNRYASNE